MSEGQISQPAIRGAAYRDRAGRTGRSEDCKTGSSRQWRHHARPPVSRERLT